MRQARSRPWQQDRHQGGFTAEERAAMKARAAELRAEGKKGGKKADGLQAVLDRIEHPQSRPVSDRR
jgi:hypothetical protein